MTPSQPTGADRSNTGTPGPASAGSAIDGAADRPKAQQPTPTLKVIPWPDPVLDRLGHDPRSAYVERFWLPTLGPSCLLLLRRLSAELERTSDGFTMDTNQWAAELGIGMRGGRNGPFWRSIERACRFGAAHRVGERLSVRRRLPPLTSRQAGRLPPLLRVAHDEWIETRLERNRRPSVVKWTPRLDRPDRPDAPPPVRPRRTVDDAA